MLNGPRADGTGHGRYLGLSVGQEPERAELEQGYGLYQFYLMKQNSSGNTRQRKGNTLFQLVSSKNICI